jgi:meiotically up-regulated gene 157 (Mug157) protein
VVADKNGFTLALGTKVPMVYRTSLRNTKVRPSLDALEATLLVPKEFIEWLLTDHFEEFFEQALVECND